MTLTELTTIIKTVDQKQIAQRLREVGYIYCNKDKKFGKVSIVELVKAIEHKTDDYADEQRNHLFNGHICGIIKGYEKYEFVLINVYDIKPSTNPFDSEETAIQTGMHIWAKEIEND